jgi:hypothetical protein
MPRPIPSAFLNRHTDSAIISLIMTLLLVKSLSQNQSKSLLPIDPTITFYIDAIVPVPPVLIIATLPTFCRCHTKEYCHFNKFWLVSLGQFNTLAKDLLAPPMPPMVTLFKFLKINLKLLLNIAVPTRLLILLAIQPPVVI